MNKNSPYREYVMGTDKKVPLPSGKLVKYINFDNAATTPPLKSVMKAINDFAPWYSSIHRGKGYKSRLSSQIYEETRELVKSFVGATSDYHTVVYVKNTTEAINKLAYRLYQSDKENFILSTDMEHHSNDLPWRKNYQVKYININKSGQLSMESLESKLVEYRGKVRLVTVTGASNVTGYINDIHQIATLVHKYGAKLMVDGAQLIPHLPVSMKPVGDPAHIDFLAFSAHKMYAPFGIGVLIAPKEMLSRGEPDLTGGGTVRVVTHDEVYWHEPPLKEEAGSPNVMGVVALKAAIETLINLNMAEISSYENKLCAYALRKLQKIPHIKLYNLSNQRRVGIIPFNIQGLNHDKVASLLAHQYGIAVRNGCFCAQPYIQKLLDVSPKEIKRHIHHPDAPHPGLVRISFGMYNTYHEVDKLITALQEIISGA